jgi:hypothetical protein
MTKVFTEDEVVKLCKAIQEKPSLYDPDDVNYKKVINLNGVKQLGKDH